MVTIALASLIIGEVFAGRRGGIGKRVVCVVLGSIVYRLIIALALRLNRGVTPKQMTSARRIRSTPITVRLRKIFI